jgi:hypothetical protein
MKVKNLNGTSNNACKCGTWIKHWEKFSGKSKPKYCCVDVCTGTELVGGHVQKDSTTDQSWYIIPICSSCNNKKGQNLTISDSTTLVSANKSNTCEK